VIEIERCSPQPKNGKLTVAIHVDATQQGVTHKLSGGRIEQTSRAIYWATGGPFGYHVSYHDADDSHGQGRIHWRLDRQGGGRFGRLPRDIDKGTEAWWRTAPAFKDIPVIQPLEAQATRGSALGSSTKDSLITSLAPVKPRHFKADGILTIILPEEAQWSLGPVLLPTKGDFEAALQEWCKRQLQIWRSELGEMKGWIIDSMKPNLALVAGWCR